MEGTVIGVVTPCSSEREHISEELKSSSSSRLKHKPSKKPAEVGLLFDHIDEDDKSIFL
jgi:hypothetical protein